VARSIHASRLGPYLDASPLSRIRDCVAAALFVLASPSHLPLSYHAPCCHAPRSAYVHADAAHGPDDRGPFTGMPLHALLPACAVGVGMPALLVLSLADTAPPVWQGEEVEPHHDSDIDDMEEDDTLQEASLQADAVQPASMPAFTVKNRQASVKTDSACMAHYPTDHRRGVSAGKAAAGGTGERGRHEGGRNNCEPVRAPPEECCCF